MVNETEFETKVRTIVETFLAAVSEDDAIDLDLALASIISVTSAIAANAANVFMHQAQSRYGARDISGAMAYVMAHGIVDVLHRRMHEAMLQGVIEITKVNPRDIIAMMGDMNDAAPANAGGEGGTQ